MQNVEVHSGPAGDQEVVSSVGAEHAGHQEVVAGDEDVQIVPDVVQEVVPEEAVLSKPKVYSCKVCHKTFKGNSDICWVGVIYGKVFIP